MSHCFRSLLVILFRRGNASDLFLVRYRFECIDISHRARLLYHIDRTLLRSHLWFGLRCLLLFDGLFCLTGVNWYWYLRFWRVAARLQAQHGFFMSVNQFASWVNRWASLYSVPVISLNDLSRWSMPLLSTCGGNLISSSSPRVVWYFGIFIGRK